jgi:proteasome accessory factor B
MSSPAATINPEDRLFHLILALMSTTHGLNKDHILNTVRGYREDSEAGMARESIERRFERDKDALRELGIPLEAIIPPEDDGNNKNTLYRIPKGDYELPPDIRFSSPEIALLNVAAAIWREGSLSKEARIAQVKLASYGLVVDEAMVGFAPIISTRDPALSALREAIDQGRVVEFDHLKPGDTAPTARKVSPFALVNHEGRWHLYGLEHTSMKEKTFLLRRIVSGITTLAEPAEPSPEDVARTALADLEAVWRRNVARIKTTPGSDAHAVLSKKPEAVVDASTITVHYTDLAIFAGELTAFGMDIVVLDPPELKELMRQHLELLVADHV